ncbi:MAG: hypothetical protein HYY28_10420 [Betaproteobacteria bacterium]|nr:hypothetical protein [Betaproteobacteria bacterium]MBI2960718.1 hypothetical protein [Betaproteobacteria bacterium]
MRNNFRTLLTTTAVLAALAGGFALYAYADSPNSRSSGGMMQGGQGGMPNMMGQMTPNSRSSGGMMQGGQGGMPNMMGMMNMMGQMSQMMESCNNMMKEMPQHPGPQKPE